MFVYLLPFIPWILAFILLLIYKKKIDEATYWGIFAIFISIFLFFLSKPELFKNSVSREIIFIIGIIILFWVYHLGRKSKFSIILSLKTLGLLLIEEYLKKDKENKPHFFRFEGPLWIDFEKGYIVEREETEEILNKLEKEQVFITGEPGSGKSTILGIVGYKLRSKNKPVFILPFKEISKIEKKDEIIKNLEKINGYLFLDDVHLNKEVGKYFKNNMKRRILFSGRKPTEKEERMDEIDQKLKNGIEIKPDNNTKRKIIERFKEITRCLFSKEIEDALLEMGNLMLLSFQLEAHINDQEEIKELKPIHSQVKDYIEEVKKSIPEADEIFLPIALFYQFEIAIRKDFLKSELGIKEEAISKMVEKREISEIEINNRKYLSLYHSKVAEVFFQTYIEFDDLGSLAKKKLQIDSDWILGFLEKYLDKFPEEGNYVVSRINLDLLLKLLSKLPDTPSLFKKIFEKSKYFWTDCLDRYDELAFELEEDNFKLEEDNFKKIFEKVNEIPLDTFKEKIEKLEKLENPYEIISLLQILKGIGYKDINELLNKLNVSFFEEIIKKSKDSLDVYFILEGLKAINYKNINELLNKLNVSFFEEIIKKSEESFGVDSLLKILKEINYKDINELLNRLNVSFFEEIIKKSESSWGVAFLLNTLKEIDYKDINELLNRLNVSFFEEIIKKSVESFGVEHLLEILKEIDYKDINELLNRLNFEEIIKKSRYSFGVDYLLEILKEIDYKDINELLNRLNDYLFEEIIKSKSYYFEIDFLLESLEKIKYPQLNELINKIEPTIFAGKIKTADEKEKLLNILEKLNYLYLEELKKLLSSSNIK